MDKKCSRWPLSRLGTKTLQMKILLLGSNGQVGYELQGPAERFCQGNGQYTGEDASCQQKECETLPVPDNGSKR